MIKINFSPYSFHISCRQPRFPCESVWCGKVSTILFVYISQAKSLFCSSKTLSARRFPDRNVTQFQKLMAELSNCSKQAGRRNPFSIFFTDPAETRNYPETWNKKRPGNRQNQNLLLAAGSSFCGLHQKNREECSFRAQLLRFKIQADSL